MKAWSAIIALSCLEMKVTIYPLKSALRDDSYQNISGDPKRDLYKRSIYLDRTYVLLIFPEIRLPDS